MKTIELNEIERLYEECKVDVTRSSPVNNSLNAGRMNNKLNTDYSFMNRNSISAIMQNISTLKKS